MSSVDNRIVEMQFKNQEFENGVKTSVKSLDTLKKSLELKDAGKSFDLLQKASQNVSFASLANSVDAISRRFTTLGIMGVTALQNITNSAVNAAKNFMKSVSIDQITNGFGKYEEKIRSVQTIMNATGKSVDEVNGYLDRLMWFSDETSYGFNDMTGAIAQMTSSGGDIDKLIPLVTGLASAVAYAGKGAAEYSRAMFNINQSYGRGFLQGEDWKSLELAGVGSESLKQMMIDIGVAEGTIKKGEVTIGSFQESLTTKKWANTKVMEKSLGEFSKLSEAVYIAVKNGEYETAAEAIEGLKSGYSELAVKAFKAAQTAKTFTEAIYATKDAVSTGWMKTFELVFGNIEEASALWSGVTKDLWDVFASGAADRNDLLKGWRALGGREELIKVYVNLYNTFKLISGQIKEVFKGIFPPMTAEKLMGITQGFQKFTAGIVTWLLGMNGGELRITQIGKIFKGIFSIFDIGIKIVSSIGKVLGDVFNSFAPGAVDGLLTFFANIGESISAFAAGLDTDATFLGIFKTIGNVLSWFISQAPGWWAAIIGFFSSDKAKAWYKSVTDFFEPVIKPIRDFIKKFRATFLGLFGIKDVGDTNGKTVMQQIQEKLGTPEGIQSVLDNVKALFAGWGASIKAEFAKIKAYFKPLTDWIGKYVTIIKDFLSNLFGGVGEKGGVSIWDQFKGIFGSSKDIKELADGIIALVSKVWADLKRKIIEIFTGKKKTGGFLGQKASAGMATDFGYRGGEDKKGGFFAGIFAFLGDLGKWLSGNFGWILGVIGGIILIKALFSVLRIINVFGDIGKTLAEFKTRRPSTDYAQKFLQIAGAVVLIVGAIYAITLMAKDPNFGTAIAVVAGIIAVLAVLVLLNSAFGKIPSGASLNNMGTSMLGIAGSVVLIIYAIKQVQEMLGSLKKGETIWSKFGPAIVAVGIILAALIALNRLGGGGKGIQGNWKSILAIAAAVWILVKTLKPLANMSNKQLSQMGKALAGITGAIAALMLISKIPGGARVKGIIALAIGMWAIVQVMLPFANYDDTKLERMGKVLAALTAAISIMMLASTGMSAGAGFGALLSLAGMAGVIWVVGDALSKVQYIDTNKVKTFITAISWMFVALAAPAIVSAVGGITGGAGALLLLAGAAGSIWTVGDALSKIQNIDSTKVEAFGNAVSKIILTIAAPGLVAVFGGVTGGVGALLTLAGGSANIWTVGDALSKIQNIDTAKVEAFGSGVSKIILAIAAPSVVAVFGGVTGGIGALLSLAGAAGTIWTVGDALSKIQNIETAKVVAFTEGVTSMINGFSLYVGISGIIGFAGIGAALTGLLGVIATVTLVVAAFSLLAADPAFNDFINRGASSIGGMIGSFIGSMKASEMTAFAAGLEGFNAITVDKAAVQNAIDVASLLQGFADALPNKTFGEKLEDSIFWTNIELLSIQITAFATGIGNLATAIAKVTLPESFVAATRIAIQAATDVGTFLTDLAGPKTTLKIDLEPITAWKTFWGDKVATQDLTDHLVLFASAIGPMSKSFDTVTLGSFGAKTTEIVAAMTELATFLTLLTGDTFSGLQGGMEWQTAFSAFIIEMPELGTAVAGFNTNIALVDTGKVAIIITSLTDFVKSLDLLTTTVTPDAIATIKTSISELSALLSTDLVTGVATGIQNGTVGVTIAVGTLVTDSIAVITNAWDRLVAAGYYVALAFSTGVESGVSRAITAAFNLVQGLASGIAKYTYLATSAATILGNKVQEAYNAASKINSPSELMTDSGRNLVLGLANGINSAASVAVKAAENLSSNVSDAIKNGITNGITNPNYSANMAETLRRGLANSKSWAGAPIVSDVDFKSTLKLAEDAGKEIVKSAENKSKGLLDLLGIDLAVLEDYTSTTKPVFNMANLKQAEKAGKTPPRKPSGGASGVNASGINTAGIAARLDYVETVGRGLSQTNTVAFLGDKLDKFGEKLDKLGQTVASMQIVMDSGALVGQIASKMDKQLGTSALYAGRGN